jgi:hypothetical protein
MAHHQRHKKIQDKLLGFIAREMSMTLVFWLVLFLIVAIVKLVG